MLVMLDAAIGQITRQLETEGLMDNTIIGVCLWVHACALLFQLHPISLSLSIPLPHRPWWPAAFCNGWASNILSARNVNVMCFHAPCS